ncbi:MAG: Xcc1710-like domain-containing protein [Gammaproteobacteria bacterium]|nr:Xcc1710-like domain-containing protein [Gammaproteobacteria bacterium]
MELHLDKPDYEYFLRGADGASALVNERRIRRSFVISPSTLVEDWPVHDAAALQAGDLDALLALEPELILLGTGAKQVFPPAEVLGASLSRGIALESMTNDSAARTYHVLAGEGRRVVAAFIFPAG